MCKLPYKIQPKNRVQLVQLINYAFKHKQYDLNFIDTSKITDMSYLFDNVNHNFDISCWDVSNVTNTEFMFDCCFEFKGKGITTAKHFRHIFHIRHIPTRYIKIMFNTFK